MDDPAAASMRLSSDLDEIAPARAWIREHAQRAGVDDQEIFDLQLAMSEAVSNIIRHGYSSAPGRTIWIDLSISERELRLVLRDDGVPLRPSDITPIDLDDPQGGGYGLFLIDELMDEVVRESDGDGTTLTLVKHR